MKKAAEVPSDKLRAPNARAKNPWPMSDTEGFGSRRTGYYSSTRSGFGVSGRPAGGFGSVSRRLADDGGFGRSAYEPAGRGGCFGAVPSGESRRSSRVGSEIASASSRKSRPSRRSGRGKRGRGPSHCFHCGERGHISKQCPQKAHLDEGDEADTDTFIDSPTKPSHYAAMMSAEDDSRQLAAKVENKYNARLENQKARESYYGYPADRPKPVDVVDKFSEQLENALKLGGPQGDENEWDSPASSVKWPLKSTAPKTVQKAPRYVSPIKKSWGAGDVAPEGDVMRIETRRSVLRDGARHFEEQMVISFPRDLPDNVRVITAQFLPRESK